MIDWDWLLIWQKYSSVGSKVVHDGEVSERPVVSVKAQVVEYTPGELSESGPAWDAV